MVIWVAMKTTIEIPDPLFRKAKSHAAEHGQTLKDFVADALRARLATEAEGAPSGEPKWMTGFGKLRRLRKETARIQGVIDGAFEVVEAEDRL
jgi:plasmid stability protein